MILSGVEPRGYPLRQPYPILDASAITKSPHLRPRILVLRRLASIFP